MKIAALFRSISKSLLLLTFLVPFVVTRFSMFPLVFGKTLFFNVFVELSLLFFAFALLIDFDAISLELRARFGQKQHNIVLTAALIFLTTIVLSTIFAQFHYTAFWGSPDRNEGLFAYLHYGIFVFLAYTLFSKTDWIIYLAGSVATALIISLVAWIQYAGIPFNFLYRLPATTQPGSYAGNPAYLAAYLIMFLVFFAAHAKSIQIDSIRVARSKKIFLVSFLIFIAATILITGIRGALLGIIAGFSMYCIASLLLSESKRIKRIMAGGILVIILVTGLFVATRHHPFWQSVPTVKRFTKISMQNASLITRLYSWKAGLEGFLEHPITGWGHESFGAVFNKYGDPRVARYGDEWFDRPHNKLIEVLVTDGSLGLLAYLFLLGTLFYIYRKEPLLIGCLTAYCVQNLFIFDNNLSSTLMAAFIAFSAQRYMGDFNDATQNLHSSSRISNRYAFALKGVSLVSVLAVLYIIPSLHITELRQQLAFGDFVTHSSVVTRTALLDSVLYPFNHMQPRMRMQMIEFLRSWDSVRHPEAQDMVIKATSGLEEALAYEPYEARYYMRLGEIYTDIALQDKRFFPKAEKYASMGIDVAPTQQKLYYLHAFILGRQSRYDLAIEVARKGVAIDPGTARAHLYVALPGIASSEKSTNVYYNPSDIKFAEYRKEGFNELYTSFDLASRLVDGTVFTSPSQLSATQFNLFERTDFTNMALLFSRAGDPHKVIATAQNGLHFYKHTEQLYQYAMAGQVLLKDTKGIRETFDRIATAKYADQLPIEGWRKAVNAGDWDSLKKDSFIGPYVSTFASPQTDLAASLSTGAAPLASTL